MIKRFSFSISLPLNLKDRDPYIEVEINNFIEEKSINENNIINIIEHKKVDNIYEVIIFYRL